MVQAKEGPRLVKESSEMLNINCLEYNDTHDDKIKCSFKFNEIFFRWLISFTVKSVLLLLEGSLFKDSNSSDPSMKAD